jgi:hypothetical protein
VRQGPTEGASTSKSVSGLQATSWCTAAVATSGFRSNQVRTSLQPSELDAASRFSTRTVVRFSRSCVRLPALMLSTVQTSRAKTPLKPFVPPYYDPLDTKDPLNVALIKLAIRHGAKCTCDLRGHGATIEFNRTSWTVAGARTSFEALLDMGRWLKWSMR